MNTRDLHIFLKIADYNSITRAAEDVRMTQPAVSSILKRMEDELGYPLFIRRGKWLALNAQGRLFYRSSRKFLEEFSHVREGLYLGDFPKEELVFRICRNSDALYTLIGRFAMFHPDIRLILQRGSASHHENLRRADFTVSLEKEHEHQKPFLPLEHRAALYALLPKSNPLASKNHLTLDDLREERFVFLKNSDDSIPEGSYQTCIQLGFQPKVAVFTDSNTGKYAAIRCGCGIGLSYDNELSFAPRISSWKIIPVATQLNVDWVGLSWSKDGLSESGHLFLDFVRREGQTYGY